MDKGEFQYILWLDRIYQKIASVPGNIIEVGVARGRNSVIFGRMIELHGEQSVRKYYGFDTFEGYSKGDLAENKGLDANAWKSLDIEQVKWRIQNAGLSKISFLTKGDIRQTAPKFVSDSDANFPPDHLRIALLYIDYNAYYPAYFSMCFFRKYMASGGIIRIDEKKQAESRKRFRNSVQRMAFK